MGSDDPELLDAAARLLSCCPEATLLVSLDGRVLSANDAATSIFGGSAEVVGTPLRELCSLPTSVALSTMALVPPTPFHISRADGFSSVFELTVFPFPQPSAVARIALIRPLAATYERARQLHRLSATGSLARAVAHDLNNLFQMMMLSSEALASAGSGAVDDRLLTWVKQIQTALDAASGLTRRVLEATKASTAPRFVEGPIAHTIRDAVDVLNPLLGSAVELRTITPSSRNVRHDPDAIFQLLLNLVVNARQAMPSGGVVVVMVEDDDQGQGVRVSVIDEGVGMDEDTMKRMFERFFTASGCGRGIGLATVSEIAQRHEARISVDSSPGTGTRFDLVFPAAP